MASGGHIKVDTVALQQMATNLKGSAGVVDGKAALLTSHTFDGPQAGREYTADGKKVHNSLSRLTTWLKNWQTAIAKTGETMSTSATNYGTVDDSSVEKFTAQGVNLTVPPPQTTDRV
ncbi:hypothetical protein [Nocardia spumae]|uniref:hypothetical protein n=1 Tax=Nocardia spumae TaxID=2887190 RepID=UPI001D15A25C|nr:hypothetical protein [Nocardia spumae]